MGEAVRKVGYAEYLALEHAAGDIALEYHDGAVVAMSAPTVSHARLGSRLVALLGGTLEGRRRVALPGVKVRVEATNRTLVPDMAVVCDPIERSTKDPDAWSRRA